MIRWLLAIYASTGTAWIRVVALGLRAIHHVTKRVGRAVTTFELLLRGEGEAWLAAGRAGRRGDRQLELFALSTRVKASRTGPWVPTYFSP